MKYLINDTYWERENGPIFFYAGNEGAIEMFCENTVNHDRLDNMCFDKKQNNIQVNRSL